MSTSKSIPGRIPGKRDDRAALPGRLSGRPCALIDGSTVDTIAVVATDWEGGGDRLGSAASIGNPRGDGIDVVGGSNPESALSKSPLSLDSPNRGPHTGSDRAAFPEFQVSDVPVYSYRYGIDILAGIQQNLRSTPKPADGTRSDRGAAVVVPGGSTTTVGTELPGVVWRPGYSFLKVRRLVC